MSVPADKRSGLDTSKYIGDINYIDIPSSNLAFWRIALQGMTVGGASVDVVRPYVFSTCDSQIRPCLKLSLLSPSMPHLTNPPCRPYLPAAVY